MIIHEISSQIYEKCMLWTYEQTWLSKTFGSQLELHKKNLLSKCRYLYENRFLNGKLLLVQALHEKRVHDFQNDIFS